MKGCLLVALLLVGALAAPKTTRQGRASINFTSFWTNAEINQFLVDLESAYPQYSYLESIGTTLQGRDIWAMHITDESVNAGTKPIVLVDAGMIARDWMSSMVAVNLVHELVDHAYEFEQILREVEFVVIPAANPDGKEFSHTSQRAWVKNRNPNAGSDCVGVNLNRNFDANWGIADSEVWNCADTYAGTGPKSERESDAISHEIEKLSARIVAYVSIQSGGQSVMYPYWYSK
jgi:murein tripeptide amidase MpaA